MTAIVGIRCKDGIVLAADSGATTGLIMQPTKKLHLISDDCIIGLAGSAAVGLIVKSKIDFIYADTQKFQVVRPPFVPPNIVLVQGQAINVNPPPPPPGPVSPTDAMQLITDGVRPLLLAEIEAARKARGNDQDQISTSVNLLALPLGGVPYLLCLDHKGTIQEVTDDLAIQCIGSGAHLASPFLGFIRRVIWDDQLPNVVDAKLAAYWALSHTIKLASGGVQDPIKMTTLTFDELDRKWIAKELKPDELEGHKDQVADYEKYIAGYKDAFSKAATEAPPEHEPPALTPEQIQSMLEELGAAPTPRTAGEDEQAVKDAS